MIWIPKFLLHKREKLSRNPITGGRRNAWNMFPFGIWYTDSTPDSVLEQEKAEYWLTALFISLSAILLIVTWLSWLSLIALIPVLIYPLCYFIKYPGSVYFRRFFEIRTHAIEGNFKLKNVPANIRRQKRFIWMSNEAFGMASYKFYDLKMTSNEIFDELDKLVE